MSAPATKARPAPVIDVVLCLDVSSSMQDLIDSAKVKLWDLVNELGAVKPTPRLRVGLYSYGHRDYDAKRGWARKEEDREVGGTFLVGVRGRLFAVYDDYQVASAADGFAAVGCGDQVALGALYATAGTGMRPRARVRTALAAAERFSGGVRGPFVVEKLKA